jgi:type I restriction enzyme S subunit
MTALQRFKPYPCYTDSRVEWLGKVPSHWEVYSLRRRLFRQAGSIKIGPFGSALKLEFMVQEGFKVYGQENVILRDFSRGNKYIDQAKFSELAACEIRPRDIVVTMMGSSGHGAIVPDGIERGIMDSHLLRIRLPDADLHPGFLALLIDEAEYVRNQIGAAGKGAIMHGLNSSIIKNIVLAVPPTNEQSRILAFLEREAARIDALVAKKKRLIELLREKRTALVTRAVTKGLVPSVPMKDSGIEWLGEIPSHWDLKRLKALGSVELSNVDKHSVEGQEVVQLCNYTDVYYNERITSALEFMRATATREQIRRFSLRSGDVLITKDSESWTDIAVPAVVAEDLPGVLCGYHLAHIHPHSGVVGAFLSRAFSAIGLRDQFQLAANGITRFGLGGDAIRTSVFVVPPDSEQRAIASCLDRETARIDALVGKIHDAIDHLKELRMAFISAAVTGKIDVREEAA